MTELNDQVTVASILNRVTDVTPDNVEEVWQRFQPDDWPLLFALIDLAADVPQLGRVEPMMAAWNELWPDFASVAKDLLGLQVLVDHPIVPPYAAAAPVRGSEEMTAAADDLRSEGCTTIDFFLTSEQRTRLDGVVSELSRTHAGCWQQLQPADAPELFALMTAGLSSASFSELTGLDLSRDEFTLTLSLQSLDRKGIGWHRDLYWPSEWLGEDVLGVFYGIGDEPPGKGGEFLYYQPQRNQVVSLQRGRHQTTILSNGKSRDQRILHAVAKFHALDSARHLVILQCRRSS